ncbi:MAG TPA: carotenoid 1,2-hydratase, partial [Terriglobales bacterium]|nr:carotenoid 1,2-hydratase [Terriglobales bacterium]
MRTKRDHKSMVPYFFMALVVMLLVFYGGKGEGEQDVSAFSYRLALPGRRLHFPADHYSHPDFKTEWWYYTGHLQTQGGKRYGYQVTFFRFGLRDRQNDLKEKPRFSDLYMAHFALSDIGAKKFHYRERINRGYNDKAGAET